MAVPYRGSGIDLGNTKLTSLAPGVNPTDAVNFGQLANAIGGIQWKNALAATTTNIALTGEQNIDGFTTSASLVLVKNQTNAAQNGLYVSATGAWTLAPNANSSTNVHNGDIVVIENGSVNARTQWQLTTTGTITPGTTNQTWVEISFGVQYTPGTGIAITAAGVVSALGPLKYSVTVPAGSASAAITHGLNTTFVQVAVYDVSGASPVQVLVDVTITSATVVTLGFSTAPTTGQYVVVVVG